MVGLRELWAGAKPSTKQSDGGRKMSELACVLENQSMVHRVM